MAPTLSVAMNLISALQTTCLCSAIKGIVSDGEILKFRRRLDRPQCCTGFGITVIEEHTFEPYQQSKFLEVQTEKKINVSIHRE